MRLGSDKRESELIAIVGMSCKFPSAPDPDALWNLLCSGQDALTAGFDDRRLGPNGGDQDEWTLRLKTLRGGFLDGIDLFDPSAFNISAREAHLIDPQQRLLLQAAWEALEDAGQDMRRLASRAVGVFAGVWGSDYQARLFRHYPDVDISMAAGGGRYAASGRISYAFGFEGPSLTIDTACSSGLVAVHSACQALRDGECEMALAGGVNLLLDPAITVAYLKAGALSPDGRCKFGDATADGYVRSEGVGVVVLKPLRRAQADGDAIHAIIRSSAVSHTGQTGGSLLAPGESSQLHLINQALIRAGVTADDLDYIEAHGTGTRIGDRVELAALGAMLRNGTGGRDRPCLIGSIKSNIGHTESAAGLAGLIKAVLCLKHGHAPPNLHFETPNPEVSWDEQLFQIPTALTPIGDRRGPSLAAVNSFGITGTLAHVILEAPSRASAKAQAPWPSSPDAPLLLPLSARSPEALGRLAKAIASRLRVGNAADAIDLAWSAGLKRTHHDLRLTAVGRTAEDLAAGLDTFVQGDRGSGHSASSSPIVSPPTVGWVFSGQGPQWAGMGLGLYETQPAFRDALDRIDTLVVCEMGLSVIEAIAAKGTASQLDRTQIAQPAIFAIQVATAALLTSWGLKPSMIVGHSVGEVAAALTSGLLTLEDAVRVICARARIAETVRGQGKMAALELDGAEAAEFVRDSGGLLDLAAVNGPRSVTLSGPVAPLTAACERAAAQGRFARMLNVEYPFHSALLDPLIPEMTEVGARSRVHEPTITLYSTVLGRKTDLKDFGPDYWARNLRETVLFAPAIEAMTRDGCDLFVEISPHPVLSYSIRQVLDANGSTAGVVETLRRESDAPADLMKAAGELHVLGCDLDWRALTPAQGRTVSLPTYPWIEESFWIEEVPAATATRQDVQRPQFSPGPILQQRLAVLGDEAAYWQSDLSLERFPWLGDHRVRDRPSLPAAAYIVSALEAANTLSPGCSLDDVEFHEALTIPEEGVVRLQLGVFADGQVLAGHRLVFEAADPVRPHAVRRHATARMTRSDLFEPATIAKPGEGAILGRTAFYESMTRAQLDYGASFQRIDSLVAGSSSALAELGPASPSPPGGLDPATVDACLQTLLALVPGWGSAQALWLPHAIQHVRPGPAVKSAGPLTCLARGSPSAKGLDFTGDVLLLNNAGEVLLSLEGVRLHKVGGAEATSGLMHEIRWIAQPSMELADGPQDHESLSAAAMGAGATPSERAAIKALNNAADRLGGLSVQQALHHLGFRFTPGRVVSLDDLAAEAGVAPAHRKLLRRLLAMLCEDGLLRAESGGWLVLATPQTIDLISEFDAAITSAAPDVAAFWRIFANASLNLPEVLSGRMDAVEVLFGDEGAALLQNLYSRHLLWQAPMRQLAAALSALVQQRAPGRPLKVLEIGAGTGGLTSYLLPLLPGGDTRYVFTDRTAYFFGAAHKRFSDYPFLSEQLLDIELDPLVQGFEADQFDVVIAANCLHATLNLGESVDHAARLLKPGGVLLLQEETAKERWTDLIFGLTDGWWRFQDEAVRPDHALLAPMAWTRLLEDHGFDDVSVLGGQETDPGGSAAIIARKRPAAGKSASTAWLLLGDESGLAARLADRLAEMGQTCCVVSSSEDTDCQEALDAYLAEADEPGRRIIDFRPLDACLRDDERQAALIRTTDVALDKTLGILRSMIECNQLNPPQLVIVTAGSQATGDDQGPMAMIQAALWTLARGAALENPLTPIMAIDLDAAFGEEAVEDLTGELMATAHEPEVALRRGRRLVRRLYRCDQPDESRHQLLAGPFSLHVVRRGAMDGFESRSVDPKSCLGDEVQIRVAAAGVNFRDLLNLLGEVDNVPLGLECSGVVTEIGPDTQGVAVGDIVMAAGFGTWGSFAKVPAALTVRKPTNLSHEQAAALPIAYLTAHYALRHLSALKPGQRVLVHSAAGGFGLAALHMARAMGGQVLGTAGSAAKRAFILGLGAVQVADSRSLSFAEDIAGTGKVDVVVNSLTGPFIPASLDLLAEGGVFIEVGKRNIWTREQVAARRPDVDYHVVDLAGVMRQSPVVLQPMLQCVVDEIERGVLPPLPIRAFPMSDAFRALKFMQEARHTGKIVLSLPPLAESGVADTQRADPSGATLITGGLGGLGLELAHWLAARGHRKLILVGRNPVGERAAAAIDDLRAQGLQIWIDRCDVGDEADVARLIERCGQDLPALRGVFHLAGLLDDAPVTKLSVANFHTVYAPKVFGAWSLHSLTRHMPLEHFVMFSSWTALLGSPGQANHASANAFLDALAHHRRAQGLAAQSINWGGWRDVGSAADPVRLGHLARQGMGALGSDAALDCLGLIVDSDAIQVAVSPFDPAVWKAFAGAAAGAVVLSQLRVTRPRAVTIEIAAEQSSRERPLRETLSELTPGPARRTLFETRLKTRLSQVLRTPAKALDVRKPFKSLGLDSLTALELRNALEIDTGLKLPASLIFNHVNIAKLATELAERMGAPLDAATPTLKAASDDDMDAVLQALQTLPDHEALLLLDEGAPERQ